MCGKLYVNSLGTDQTPRSVTCITCTVFNVLFSGTLGINKLRKNKEAQKKQIKANSTLCRRHVLSGSVSAAVIVLASK